MSRSITNRASQTFGLPKSLHAFGVNVLLLPLGIATSILIARTVGPAGKGSLDLIIATAALLTTFLSLSLPPGLTFIVAQGKSNLGSLVPQLLLIALVQTLLAVAILGILRATGYARPFLPDWGAWIVLGVGVYVCVDLLTRYWGAILMGQQQNAIVNNAELAGRIAQFLILFTVAGALYLSGKKISVSLLFVITLTVNVLINLFLFKSLAFKFRFSSDTQALKGATNFALPCFIANSAQFLNYRLDVFIVGFFAGTASVGRYTLAVSLAQLLWLMSNSVASVLLPKVAASADTESNIRHTSRVSRLSLWGTASGAIALAVVGIQAIPTLYGDAFIPSVSALLWILPGIVAFSVVNVLAAYIAGIGKPRLNLIVSCIALVVTVTLDLTLIPRLNIVGASIASTASYSLGALLTVFLFVRETGSSIRDVLVPTADDIKLLFSLVKPILRRTRLQRA